MFIFFVTIYMKHPVGLLIGLLLELLPGRLLLELLLGLLLGRLMLQGKFFLILNSIVRPCSCRVLHHCTVHCTMQQLRCTAQCTNCAALRYTILHCTAPYCTALHCIAMHHIVMHCTAQGYKVIEIGFQL